MISPGIELKFWLLQLCPATKKSRSLMEKSPFKRPRVESSQKPQGSDVPISDMSHCTFLRKNACNGQLSTGPVLIPYQCLTNQHMAKHSGISWHFGFCPLSNRDHPPVDSHLAIDFVHISAAHKGRCLQDTPVPRKIGSPTGARNATCQHALQATNFPPLGQLIRCFRLCWTCRTCSNLCVQKGKGNQYRDGRNPSITLECIKPGS